MIEQCLNELKLITSNSYEKYTKEEVNNFESTMQIKFPIALKEYYSIIGKSRNHLSFLPFEDIEIIDDIMTFFKDEDSIFGIKLDNKEKEDPPVYQRFLTEDTGRWYCEGKCSYFILNFIALEIVYSLPYMTKVRISRNRFSELIEKKLIKINKNALSEIFTDEHRKVLVVFINRCTPTLYIASHNKSYITNIVENTGIKINIKENSNT
ncbi:hypothetical protein [Clostridium lundense]|uniref:hypothetical protein n=1 Tax=Clostridium lundense TaxID=319475 RepID=UPI000480942C|nr:hypothetical protein [Clostridium lundense]